MSGLDLREMEASDMVDVIHFLFEEDSHYTSEESAKSRSAVRVSLYRDMYKKPYKYEYKDSKKQSTTYSYNYEPEGDLGTMSEEEDIKPFDPLAERKPDAQSITKFNPTANNPFSGILDAPFN